MARKVEAFYEGLGRRIEQCRRRNGLTQQQLADCLRPPVTRAAISGMENGKQRVLAHVLADIAAALGVSIGKLADGMKVTAPAGRPIDLEEQLARQLRPDRAKAVSARVEALAATAEEKAR